MAPARGRCGATDHHLDSQLDAVEMKFIYDFYDLVAGTACRPLETHARDIKKLVSDFSEYFSRPLTDDDDDDQLPA